MEANTVNAYWGSAVSSPAEPTVYNSYGTAHPPRYNKIKRKLVQAYTAKGPGILRMPRQEKSLATAWLQSDVVQ